MDSNEYDKEILGPIEVGELDNLLRAPRFSRALGLGIIPCSNFCSIVKCVQIRLQNVVTCRLKNIGLVNCLISGLFGLS